MNNFVVCVKMEVFSDRIDEFIPMILKNAKQSLQEEGCMVFDVSRRENIIYLYEVYESEQAFASHLKTEHFLHFDDLSKKMISSKVVETYYRLID